MVVLILNFPSNPALLVFYQMSNLNFDSPYNLVILNLHQNEIGPVMQDIFRRSIGMLVYTSHES